VHDELERKHLRSDVAGLPEWTEGLLLKGVPAFDQRWTVRTEDGAVTVEPAES